jgi:membrane associated rhomboid family serine protease
LFITFVEDSPASKRIPWANTTMIILNIFICYQTLGRKDFPAILGQYGFIPVRHLGLGVLTGFFLHSSWAQLVANMTFLYMFGRGVEQRLGKWNYLIAYFVVGFASEAAHWYFHPQGVYPLVGASRIVTGLGVIYLLLYPWGKMKWFFSFFGVPLFEIPSRTLFVMGFWAAVQAAIAFFPWSKLAFLTAPLSKHGISLFTLIPTAGAAWEAHLGALAAGVVLHFLMPHKKSKG